jgi:hypothetical protein
MLVRVGNARPPPFYYIYHHVQSYSVNAPAEWADALVLFHLYQYTLDDIISQAVISPDQFW